jgi:hypothetical protein
MSFLRLVLVAGLFVGLPQATESGFPNYVKTVTGVTSAVISPVEHKLSLTTGVGYKAAGLGGTTLPPAAYNVSTTENGTVIFSFSAPFTGTLTLQQIDRYTAAETDFQPVLVTVDGTARKLAICAQCSQPGKQAVRNTSAGRFAMAREAALHLSPANTKNGTVRVYLRPNTNKVTFGLTDIQPIPVECQGPCEIAWGITAFPPGVCPLAQASYSGLNFTGLEDKRAF